MRSRLALALLPATLLVVVTACGSEDASADDGRPTVVVTTSILGDVVSEVVGDAARVVVVMPAGADPHDFQPSAQQVDEIRSADALVTNGGSFEVGLLTTLESAEDDVPTVHALDTVDALTFGATAPEEVHDDDAEGHAEDEHAEDEHAEDEHAEDEHAEDEHAEDEHAEDEHAEDEHAGGEEGHDEEGGDPHAHDGDDDPHFFTDPDRVADAAAGIAAFLAEEVPALASDEVADRAAAYVDELRTVAAEVEETLAPIPSERRVIITNHEVFGYFADRYDFEVIGAVIPGGGTGAEPSAGDLDELAHLIEEEGVPAIFADATSPARLADTLAAEVGGDVEVVSLFTESLGEEGSGAETYVDLVRTNADRILEALG